jgi:hypothetical protein
VTGANVLTVSATRTSQDVWNIDMELVRTRFHVSLIFHRKSVAHRELLFYIFMLSIFDLRVKHGVADWAPSGKLETGRNWKHMLSHYIHCREAILDVAPDEAPGS